MGDRKAKRYQKQEKKIKEEQGDDGDWFQAVLMQMDEDVTHTVGRDGPHAFLFLFAVIWDCLA